MFAQTFILLLASLLASDSISLKGYARLQKSGPTSMLLIITGLLTQQHENEQDIHNRTVTG